MYGGDGNDRLYGDKGYDKFVFSEVKHNGYDKIHDFNSYDDKLEFSLKDLEYATKKDLDKDDIKDYVAINNDGKAEDYNDYIVYNSDDGKLYFDYDGSGHGHALQLAELFGHPHVDEGDFYLA